LSNPIYYKFLEKNVKKNLGTGPLILRSVIKYPVYNPDIHYMEYLRGRLKVNTGKFKPEFLVDKES
jgi:hypothetical protein